MSAGDLPPEAGSAAAGAGAPVSMSEGPSAILRHRDFRLYLSGRFIASLGSQMLVVAVGWELYERTHAALALGIVGLTNVIGLATIGFGFSRWFLFSWMMLCVCGITDQVSVLVRHTLVQLLTPDEKRGRVSAVNSLFIGTSNELGGFESGFVAHWLGPVVTVVCGGVGTIFVVAAVAWIWPEIRKYGRLDRE